MKNIQRLIVFVLFVFIIPLFSGCGKSTAGEVLDHATKTMNGIKSFSYSSTSNEEQTTGLIMTTSYKDTLNKKVTFKPYRLYQKETIKGGGKNTGNAPYQYEQDTYATDQTEYSNSFSNPNRWMKNEWKRGPHNLTKKFKFIQKHPKAFTFKNKDHTFRFSAHSADDTMKSFFILLASSYITDDHSYANFKNMMKQSKLLHFDYQLTIDKKTFQEISSKINIQYQK